MNSLPCWCYGVLSAYPGELFGRPTVFCLCIVTGQFFAFYTSRYREEGKNQRNAGELRHRHGSPMADIGIQRHEDVGLDRVDSSPSSGPAADGTPLLVARRGQLQQI